MKYNQIIILKNGFKVTLRNGTREDGVQVFEVFNKTHGESDYLLSYPDENSYNAEQESEYLERKTNSDNEIEMIATIDNKVVGLAGIEAIGYKYKVKHRADFGISVLKEYWGLGLGKALAEACIECAKKAGYKQLELNVVADNERAIGLYKSLGFVEYGRNPKGFNSRTSGYQELVYMFLDLE